VDNNFDLLFARMEDILGTQIKLEAQQDLTNKVVEQMMKDQQILTKQIENTGQAVREDDFGRNGKTTSGTTKSHSFRGFDRQPIPP